MTWWDRGFCIEHSTLRPMQTENQTRAPAPTAQLPQGETKTYQELIRDFLLTRLPGSDLVYAVPLQLQDMHKRACKTICAATMIVHLQSRGNSIILLPTQTNVYFIWLACMQAMHSISLQPMHPKAAYAEYFKDMALEKIVVLLPVVCLWVCVKCMEIWELRSNDILFIIDGVQKARNYKVDFTFEDVVHAEHVLLQLIDFDVLKHQENIDSIEDILRNNIKNFQDMHVSVDPQVARSLFCVFYDVVDGNE